MSESFGERSPRLDPPTTPDEAFTRLLLDMNYFDSFHPEAAEEGTIAFADTPTFYQTFGYHDPRGATDILFCEPSQTMRSVEEMAMNVYGYERGQRQAGLAQDHAFTSQSFEDTFGYPDPRPWRRSTPDAPPVVESA